MVTVTVALLALEGFIWRRLSDSNH
jgi:hypothetical protein